MIDIAKCKSTNSVRVEVLAVKPYVGPVSRLEEEVCVCSDSSFLKGSKRCFPNGGFQIPEVGLQSDKSCQRETKSLKTPVFSSILVPSALLYPDHL